MKTIKHWLLQAMKKYQGRKSANDQVKVKNRSLKLSSQGIGVTQITAFHFFQGSIAKGLAKKTDFA